MSQDMVIAITSAPAAQLVVKATVIVAIALVAARMAQGARAALRHLILATACGALLVLPLAAAVLPSLTISLPIGPTDTGAFVRTEHVDADAGTSSSLVSTGASASNAARHRSPEGVSTLVRVAWVTGSSAVLLPILTGLWQLHSLRKRGVAWQPSREMLQELRRCVPIRRRVDVLLHQDTPSPIACGVLRPTIIVPPDFPAWPPDNIRQALVHELEHIRRHDWLIQCLARVACAVYWFHPFVWNLRRKLELDAECACDDVVIQHTDSKRYAGQLVQLAERLATRGAATLAMARNRGDLSVRVAAVLDSGRVRGRVEGFVAASIGVAGLAFVIAASPVVLAAGPRGPVSRIEQTPSPVLESSFEVVSIRPNKTGDNSIFINILPGGRFSAINVTLRELIQAAHQFEFQSFQIVGGDRWFDQERFNVDARSGRESSPQEISSMVRAMLAERFGLVAHRETRQLPVYALVLARQDRALGERLRPASGDCAPVQLTPGGPPTPPDPDMARCGVRTMPATTANGVRLTGTHMRIEQLNTRLTRYLERVVVDDTGLTGLFGFDLEFVDPRRPGVGDPREIDAASAGLSLSTALQEQLGLRLESRTGPVQVLRIESAHRPTEN